MADELTRQVSANYIKQLSFPQWLVEKCLYEVAAHGGNLRAGMRTVRAELEDHIDDDGEKLRIPTDESVRLWRNGKLRNRYSEIASGSALVLEERIAQGAIERALALEEVEDRATKQTLAGLADATAVEASQILRNVTQSKTANIDKAAMIRGRGAFAMAERSLEQIAEALQRIGVMVADDPLVDAEVIEDPA